MKRSTNGELVCSFCKYSTNRYSNYLRHQSTESHKKRVNFIGCRDTRITLHDEDPRDIDSISTQRQSHESGVELRSSERSDNPDIIVEEEAQESDSMDSNESESESSEQFDSDSWYPFASKIEMLLYILLNSRTHTLSDETARFIWFIMKESGITVPSFNKVKEMKFGDLCVDQMIKRVQNKDGKPFYVINPSSLLKLEIAKPRTASKLIRYPRSGDQKKFEEQADGSKFKNLNWHWATLDGKEYFKGDFVTWNEIQIGKITSFCNNTELNTLDAVIEEFSSISHEDKSYVFNNGSTTEVPLKNVKLIDTVNFAFCKQHNQELVLLSTEEKMEILQSERVNECKPVVDLPFNLFLDDTSANVSKKWRPLHCIQMQLAGIPVQTRQRAETIKHICSSIEVDTMDLLRPIVDDIIKLKREGVPAYDAHLRREVLLKSDIAACVCDFNMLAEAANHMGPNTKKFCPRCYADASNIQKTTERDPIKSQRILQRLSLNNNKDLRQKHGLKPYENCLWEIINPHSDIPVGQLHWLYLGLGKFVMKKCIEALSDAQIEKLNAMIDSCDQTVLQHRISNDFIKYIDSRQGKDVKSYLQIAPLHLALCGLEREKVKVICRLSELSKIFTLTEKYSSESIQIVENKIENLLADIKTIFPGLTSKVKTHMSTHITEDIENHGPPTAYREDAFEKMHGRIRGQIVLQNQHAISRDTAVAFAEFEILNHVLTGGFFKYHDKWVQSTEQVQSLATSKEICSYLSIQPMVESEEPRSAGLIKLQRNQHSKPVKESINGQEMVNLQALIPSVNFSNGRKIVCHATKTKQGEIANENSAILYVSDEGIEAIGVFKCGYRVITESGDFTYDVVKIQKMEKKEDARISGIACETIVLTNDFFFVKPFNVLQLISLVHACSNSCHFKETFVEKKLEQETQNVHKKIWCHSNVDKTFYVNKFCLGHKKPKYMC